MAKILFVTNDAWFFVSHRLPIARKFAEQGGRSIVAAKDDQSVSAIADAGAQFSAWHVSPRGKSIVGELQAFLSLVKIVRHHRPDIIHLITIKPVLYGGLIARLFKIPCCVYAVSGLGSVMLSDSMRGKLLRALIFPFYKIAMGHKNGTLIFQNPDDRDQLINMLANDRLKTLLIKGSGVSLSDYQIVSEPTGTPVVTLAARLLKDKGIDEFIAAARKLKENGVLARFQIAGGNVADGNPAAYSTSELEALNKNGVVEVLGHCDDIATLFANSNLIVLPSYREGLPKVLIEAGASGRAVITTNVPGCRDAIEEGKTGLLVPVRDSDALAEAMQTLIEDSTRREAMGAAGRVLVEREMSIETVVGEHMTIYQTLLNNSGINS